MEPNLALPLFVGFLTGALTVMASVGIGAAVSVSAAESAKSK